MRRKDCILNAFYSFTFVYVLLGLYFMQPGPTEIVTKEASHEISKSHNITDWNNLLLRDTEGRVVLNKTIQNMWEGPLRKWDYKQEILAFIHIAKSGGTSFEVSLLKSTHPDGCTIKCVKYITELGNRNCPAVLRTLCQRHFDWTTIEELEDHGIRVAPLVILRDPIERAVSHFHFAQKMPETKGHKIRGQNLSEFLQDPESMMETRQIWYDGQVKSN